MRTFCFYMCVFFTAGSGDIPICSSKQQVTASVGDTARLSCHLSYGKSSNLSVVWKKTTEGAEDIVVLPQNIYETLNYNQNAAYIDRTAMNKDGSQLTDAALNVNRVRPEDAGEYSCWVIQPPPSQMTSYKCCSITLYVAQEWKGDKIQLVVAWSVYISILSLCIFLLYSCRQRKSPLDELYEI